MPCLICIKAAGRSFGSNQRTAIQGGLTCLNETLPICAYLIEMIAQQMETAYAGKSRYRPKIQRLMTRKL